ncbi:MAG: hypothetical protein EBS11_05890 [Janthinobacterium sp.]|nr:hypothetical protein [Janthinobacterium sp.]
MWDQRIGAARGNGAWVQEKEHKKTARGRGVAHHRISTTVMRSIAVAAAPANKRVDARGTA